MGWSSNYKEVGVRRNYDEGVLGIRTFFVVFFLISSRDIRGFLEIS